MQPRRKLQLRERDDSMFFSKKAKRATYWRIFKRDLLLFGPVTFLLYVMPGYCYHVFWSARFCVNHLPFIYLIYGLFALSLRAELNSILEEENLKRKHQLQSYRNSQVDSIKIYTLYLRSFETDDIVFMANPFFFEDDDENRKQINSFGDAELIFPEEFIGRVLEPYIDVLQVGGSDANIGPARIFVDDSIWQERVGNAVNAASIIILMPLVTEMKNGSYRGLATMWELQFLVKSGKIERTIILMPPSNHFGKAASGELNLRNGQNDVGLMEYRRAHIGDGWEAIKDMSSRIGLQLPCYTDSGAVIGLFKQEGDGAWRYGCVYEPAPYVSGMWSRNKCEFALCLLEMVACVSDKYNIELSDR